MVDLTRVYGSLLAHTTLPYTLHLLPVESGHIETIANVVTRITIPSGQIWVTWAAQPGSLAN